eukprot:TRINITY_DN19479_c0_g1::TRINITY_DN19479_c0_g1_i1::g.17160::m.17160 TRINITY_DN19479_c0_g1::TRINITY_DN19479_c0_g1_i1::g.17160  ORF type:complete len:464 (+),score=124.50,sp/P14285/CHRA_PSEAI/36.65/3e-83,Chromate_transp/PF02417.10/3.6e-36,Chromate_transp/PF02417.10/5.7e+03,Chromate_transp/PF02417.10/1.1e-30,DUF962/PF06127.6/0.15,SdpI/PF13630.1/1.9e+02,SdpI/PF13630.1/5.4,SdpI/PF13630.1/0.57,SdpI/PF13630.1/1.4e+03 TRINITY_DN19479_c0_g1_i1:82-1473(+)
MEMQEKGSKIVVGVSRSQTGPALIQSQPTYQPLPETSADGDDVEKQVVNPPADDEITAPHLGLLELFKIFLIFGFRAFGGPVAQIAMMKQQLVVEEKWMTMTKFNRVLAVYQVLPGPEATELACYFGYISRGRIGAILGGLGFVIPGFIMMLVLSWVYKDYGLDDKYVQASFAAIQPCVSAMIFKAVHKLGEHAFADGKTHEFSYELASLGLLGFLMSAMHINFFLTLGFCGLLHTVYAQKQRWSRPSVAALTLVGLVIYILIAVFQGVPTNASLSAGGIGKHRDNPHLFVLGLLAGLLTFGGAYTAVPFVQQDVCAVDGGWMTDAQFLDGIAITSIVPTPLVTFSTFVGFMGNRFAGSILMTLGIFIPAFSFTLIGHSFFEKVVEWPRFAPFLDGITAGVIGMVLVTACEFLKNIVDSGIDSAIFVLSLIVMAQSKNRYTQPALIVLFGIAGQIIFIDENSE